MPKMEKTFRISNRRYLGSKAKLISFIHSTIKKENIVFNSFLDLFAGTGSVADSFNDGNHKIILNDILESNRCIFNAFFGNEVIDHVKILGYIKVFNNKSIVESNYFSENYSNTFFSETNSIKIGYIRDQIDFFFSKKTINEREKDYLISSLLFSMDRIANTVGHYDAYRRKGDLSKKLVLFPLDVYSPEINVNNEIYRMDSNELVSNLNVDMVYIDPPYNSRQYSDAYHVLENVASWKKPKVYGVARKMDRSHIKSKYNQNSAPRVFAKLIDDLKCKYIIVSYNNMGMKGANRSQAKISDIDIIRSLEQKGNVTIHEIDFNQFTAGKTNIQGHKERLFVCKVGVFKKTKQINIPEFVKSPLNYTGGKFKLLSELIHRFPTDYDTFIDLFGGGFNVGVNASSKSIVYNDISEPTTRLIKLFYNYGTNDLINKIDDLIKKYGLSDSNKNGYEFYNSNSSTGLGSYNKKAFLKLKDDYNNLQISIDKDFLMLLLTIYSFNNQIRFNSKGFYNLPVGKRDFNSSIRKNIKLFSEKIKTKNVFFLSKDFNDIKYDQFINPFFYCDPPYLLGEASYNENGGWNESKERELLSYLNRMSLKGVKFGLSNVIEHKGKKNIILLDWAINNKFNIFYINNDYSNSNYQIKNKNQVTIEVFITNY